LQVPAAESVMKYAVRLILNTHPDHPGAPDFIRQYVRYGSSPRGAQAMILSAKIQALRERRYNASVDDVKAAALPALRHRLILNIEGQAENVSTEHLISQLLDRISPEA
jgi:MoxR-like ATPase